MLHCDLRVRWKVASDLRFRAAISEPKTPSFCGISGDLAPSTRKSIAIAIVRFWCAKSVPSRTGGESILEMFWSLQMPWIIGFGGSQLYSRGEFQETFWERFWGLSGIFRDFFRKVPAALWVWPCDPEVPLQTPKPRKIQRHKKVTQKWLLGLRPKWLKSYLKVTQK